MHLIERIWLDLGYRSICIAAVILILFVWLIVLSSKLRKQKKRLNEFMKGTEEANLEKLIKKKFNDVEQVKECINKAEERVSEIDATLCSTFQKHAIVKYDAFEEMGGELSFSLALLNGENSGFVINAMHSSSQGCFTYVKEIVNGESFVTLSEEEKQAVDEAINKTTSNIE